MDYSITWITVFGAGVVSFLSPCVLPMLPTYAAFLAGAGIQHPAKGGWRFFANAISFLSGFTLLFVVMGATASYIGELFLAYETVIRKVGAVFMIIMGLHLLGILKIPALKREYRPFLHNTFAGPTGAFFLGLAFTAGWTPCIGPILATVLIYAGSAATVSQGAFLLFIYAMGFCLPFLVLALLINRYLIYFQGIYKWLPVIQKVSGIIIIIAGLFIYFDFMQKIVGILWHLFG